jgi:hypothetical protein
MLSYCYLGSFAEGFGYSAQFKWLVERHASSRGDLQWVGIFGLAAVYVNWHGCDCPHMPVVDSSPLRQPMNGGLLGDARGFSSHLWGVDVQWHWCRSLPGAEQGVASHGGRCHVG